MDKNYKTAIGMMSGTSMDGIDAVLVRIDDNFDFELVKTHTLQYPDEVRKKLLQIANNNANTSDICLMDFVVAKLFAKCANELVEKACITSQDVDFIASHGQTVFHIPQVTEIGGVSTGSTLQIGNISVIAQETGIETIGDFRSRDIAAGGQGAPLVPFADELIFKKNVPRAIQNIGGIGNVTVLSPKCETFAFDTGPGNMLIDSVVNLLFDLPYDKNGEIAKQGKVDEKWLEELLKEPYYSKFPPKSTGRELYNEEYVRHILKTAPQNKYDVVSTVTALTAKTIANAYRDFVFPKTDIKEIVIGGGGAYNPVLLNFLKVYTELEIKTHKDFGIDDKFKEAIAFAMLGYCTVKKTSNNLPNCTGAAKKVIMGVTALG